MKFLLLHISDTDYIKYIESNILSSQVIPISISVTPRNNERLRCKQWVTKRYKTRNMLFPQSHLSKNILDVIGFVEYQSIQ